LSSLGSDFLIGFAFFLVIEGLAYALAPRLIKEVARLVPDMPEERLRIFGVAALAVGVLLVWLVRS
jgi:uncharacterized protein